MTASNVSTRCRAWVLTRSDGVTMGFTDHDRPLDFIDAVRGAVTLEPYAGFTATAYAESVGLGANDMDIEGAITSDAITLADLANGVYDGAEVKYYFVDWSNTNFFDLLSINRIAEIPRNQSGFAATIEGLATKSNDPKGLRLTRSCSLEFGGDINDLGQGCGLDLSEPQFSQVAVVARVLSARSFAVEGLTFAEHWCDFGNISWTGGANNGAGSPIKSQTVRGAETIFELDLEPAGAIVIGDALTAFAGCDRGRVRCLELGNMARRLAFPMPADNVATKYARDLIGESNSEDDSKGGGDILDL